MDIGSGLSLQTRTVNGKVTTGVFLSSNSGRNARTKTKPKYPIRSRVDPDENQNTRPDKTAQETIQNILSRNQDKKQQQKITKHRTTSAKTLPPNARKTNKVVTTEKDGQNGSQASERTRNVTNPKGSTGPNEKSGKDKGAKTESKRSATEPKEKTDDSEDSQPQDVSTKFVTLTQGQLNTILSLVKSKNEIDVTGLLEEKDDEGSKDNENPNEEDKKGETQDGDKEGKVGSRPATQKSQSSRKGESVGNLLKKADKKSKNNANNDDNISSKGGENLSRESTKIEEADLNAGRKSQENLPAAIRSSFFIGEAAPRAHAFSARKREEQQRWREELDKQRTELRQKKEREKDARLKADESDSWAKHFDTMLPSKNSPRTTENFTPNPNILAKTTQSNASSDEQATGFSNAVSEIATKGESASRNTIAPIPSAGITKNAWSSVDFSENKDFVSTMTSNALPQRSSYLRTMTSLLDPAQIEANEVKRRKQDEHRRAIEAQVEERKCKKEEEQQRQQRLEAEEDRRLAADRDSFAQKTELEKLQQQMQVNLREQNTKELHQQMKNAEESALRDKLSKRERILKNRGHDTSRLEMAHQMALEMSHKVAAQPLAQTSQTSIGSNSSVLSTLQLPQEGYSSNTWTPTQVVGVIGQSSPVAVTAQTEQGPIKLEISLNQKRASELVESGMQTDDRVGEPWNLNFNSDAETEYLQAPQKRRNIRPKEKEKKDRNTKLQNFEKNLDRQYDRHSRSDRNVAGGQPRKRNAPRPKWGVRETNKTFVPASQRYTSEQQKHDAVMRKREERHVVSDPDRSKVTSHSPTKHPSEPRPKSPVEPVIRNRWKNEAPRHPPPNAKTSVRDRPSSGIYATTDHAKYRSEKHSRDSPVPETKDFVQYRRTTAVFDPNQPQSRPETGPMELRTDFVQRQDRQIHGASNKRDPLLNPEIMRQHERQEQILKEISILRQGLLIKQREVASYPAAMTHSMAVLPPTNLILAGGGNLPERTNDTPVL